MHTCSGDGQEAGLMVVVFNTVFYFTMAQVGNSYSGIEFSFFFRAYAQSILDYKIDSLSILIYRFLGIACPQRLYGVF